MDPREWGRYRTSQGVGGEALLVEQWKTGGLGVELKSHNCRSKNAGRYPHPSNPTEAVLQELAQRFCMAEVVGREAKAQ